MKISLDREYIIKKLTEEKIGFSEEEVGTLLKGVAQIQKMKQKIYLLIKNNL